MKPARYYNEMIRVHLEELIRSFESRKEYRPDAFGIIRAIAGIYECTGLLRELLPDDEEDEER